MNAQTSKDTYYTNAVDIDAKFTITFEFWIPPITSVRLKSLVANALEDLEKRIIEELDSREGSIIKSNKPIY